MGKNKESSGASGAEPKYEVSEFLTKRLNKQGKSTNKEKTRKRKGYLKTITLLEELRSENEQLKSEKEKMKQENTALLESNRKYSVKDSGLRQEMAEQQQSAAIKATEFEQLKKERNDDVSRLKKDQKTLESEVHGLHTQNKELEMRNCRLRSEVNDATVVTAPVKRLQPIQSKPEGIKVVLPQESYDDPRVRQVWEQLLVRLRKQEVDVDVQLKTGKSIVLGDGWVILPCICASRVGSDINAALDKVKLRYDIKLVIIIFNHLANHNNTIRVKTRDRLTDRSIVERCRLIVDAVFWEDRMSDCRVNDELMQELKSLLKPK